MSETGRDFQSPPDGVKGLFPSLEAKPGFGRQTQLLMLFH